MENGQVPRDCGLSRTLGAINGPSCPSRRRNHGRSSPLKALSFFLAAAALVASVSASALDPDRKIAQYHHTSWTQAEGAPTPVSRIAQSREGHLLLTSGDGLFRFDGARFERLDTGVDLDENGPPVPLLVARNGEVWTAYKGSSRFAIYRGGRSQFIPSPQREGEVIALAQTPDGAIWAGLGETGRPLFRYSGGRWRRIQLPAHLGRDQLISMVVAGDGALWLSYYKTVIRIPLGSNRVQLVLSAPYSTGRLSLDRDGRVWVSETRGSRPVSAPAGRWPAPVTSRFIPTESGARRGQPMFDRDGNLWLARRRGGLERVAEPHLGRSAPTQAAVVDEYRASAGLSSDTTISIFEDREGTLWVATSMGFDRFRSASVISEPSLKDPAAFGDILFTASDGSVYIAQAHGVYRAAPGGDPERILTNMPEPEAMCEGRDGTIFMIFADRMVARKGSETRRLPKPSPAETGVYDCIFDPNDKFWMSAAANGLYLWQRAGWQAVTPRAGARFHPTAMVADRLKATWFASEPKTLIRLEGLRAARLDYASTGLGNLRSLHVTGKGLLFSADFGVAEVRSGRIALAKGKQVAPLVGATGLIETPEGEIWAFSRSGIARVGRADLERAFSDPAHVVSARTFNFLDGLTDQHANQSMRSMVQGGDGRIWVATLAGTVWLDPAKIHSSSVPPPVAITMIEAGGKRQRDPVDLRLAAGTNDLTFTFAVLSHAIPERVQVRYKLHGFDDKWIDPGSRRQAFYTNLPPGNYNFQVIAANPDGVWNRTGTELSVEIPPTFFQSKWFALLCALAALGVLWLLYRVRIRQVGRHIRARLDERIAERERIARELHDTLLQSVQGLILSFQAATEQLQPSDPTRVKLEGTLQRADDVLAEGRDRVHELRSTEESQPLDAAITALIKASGLEPQVATQFVVRGERRSIRPIAAHELRAIVGEALRNIARHAHAKSVAVELSFASKTLILTVRDDGGGLPVGVQSAGSPAGHFGLAGMKERAAQIGGTLEIESAPGAGTTIIVMVPAKNAYAAQRSRFETIKSRFGLREAHA